VKSIMRSTGTVASSMIEVRLVRRGLLAIKPRTDLRMDQIWPISSGLAAVRHALGHTPGPQIVGQPSGRAFGTSAGLSAASSTIRIAAGSPWIKRRKVGPTAG
jgi:hypothetical protein